MNPRLRAVARSAVMAVNTPMAKWRTKTSLARPNRPLKLELGGLEPRDGWLVTNVNAVTRLYLDGTGQWPFADGELTHVYSDNMIEHVPLEGGRALMREAARCLKPGGVIRFVTPDLRGHVDRYLAGVVPKGDPEAKVYEQMGLTVDHPLDWIRIPVASFGHHEGYVYDYETLESELLAAGFSSVTRAELGRSTHADLDGLDNRVQEGGVQMAVEAIR